jgi:hypothetical protein
MSEAVNILLRARGAYLSEQRLAKRGLEKAEPGSDEARALEQRRETLRVRQGDIDVALTKLGAELPPLTNDDRT